jgi:acetate---CoA ligase (ADP-forming)
MVLEGARGRPTADIDALAAALVAVSQFAVAAGNSLATLDLNPVIARPKGHGVLALDAVLVGAG